MTFASKLGSLAHTHRPGTRGDRSHIHAFVWAQTVLDCARVPQIPSEKVQLFRSLFRGREGVFPIRFVSKKTGKPGYAPLCDNDWKPVCIPKTGGKCSDCPNRAFTPVGAQVIEGHLKGRHVMGIYPLFEDGTCWLLAADFDQRSWKEDIAAFADTCRDLGIPVAIDRSRSGNGAHAWFFFSAPVPASVARQMGPYLMTETMNRRHELSMGSYDRLFPNQDTTTKARSVISRPRFDEPSSLGCSRPFPIASRTPSAESQLPRAYLGEALDDELEQRRGGRGGVSEGVDRARVATSRRSAMKNSFLTAIKGGSATVETETIHPSRWGSRWLNSLATYSRGRVRES